MWAARTGSQLLLVDDQSRPERSAQVYTDLLERECTFVLGPYGGDCTRAVAQSSHASVVWNHGAAPDDVQRLPGVVSVCSPASRYLTALARALVSFTSQPRITIVAARGPMGQLAASGLKHSASKLEASIVGSFSFTATTKAILATQPDAVLACGPLPREIELFRALRSSAPRLLLGGISPGLRTFPTHLAQVPNGLLGIAQWHPELGAKPRLGPNSCEVVASAKARGIELDYVAAQAYAAAVIAAHCHHISPDSPGACARTLETTTFYGAFALDPTTGIQSGHRLCVVRWQAGMQDLFLPEAC